MRHTVSPVTAALWASLPFPPCCPLSMYFFALSQAPPALSSIAARSSAVTEPNIMKPASTVTASRRSPRRYPICVCAKLFVALLIYCKPSTYHPEDQPDHDRRGQSKGDRSCGLLQSGFRHNRGAVCVLRTCGSFPVGFIDCECPYKEARGIHDSWNFVKLPANLEDHGLCGDSDGTHCPTGEHEDHAHTQKTTDQHLCVKIDAKKTSVTDEENIPQSSQCSPPQTSRPRTRSHHP